ncbi:tetratricopeptide repeat protein [Mesorhizobium sp. M4A.F.Ca.ET.022.05.2.1]|uniref:rhodanese-like domain-containing protein n=1 Tax=Mesorhizobium sp. M4A.F.Ca.ET.022.05.2.1 TaxID=2496653 RepID=UPI000FCC42A7|nr:rhodanese-like domain-containing protein [Mesorhizobium sp. M4A.F.Ca.ET.022.05.2.1]RVC81784.1 tetratricopeptide repeat protein [Mesorhizobium sp. M4A.F.Ca.ET.022.05.2.1]
MEISIAFAINGVTVDLDNELLTDASGRTVGLRSQSFAVLRHLSLNADQLVTKEELAAAIWPGIAVTDDSLVQCIHEIRYAIRDEGHTVLKTVRKRGYRLVLMPHRNSPSDSSVTLATRVLPRPRLAAVAVGAFASLLAATVVWPLSSGPAAIVGPADGDGGGAELVETANPQAHDALLLGLERLHLETQEDTLKAIAYFEQAAKYDPEYSRAYAAVAAAQQKIILSSWSTIDGTELDRAHFSMRLNLAKALKQPTSLAYAVAAEQALVAGHPNAAFGLISKAREEAPHDPDVLMAEASILNAGGRPAEAELVLRRAIALDPKFAPAALRLLAAALFQQGKYQEAVATVDRIAAQGAATTGDYITLVASLGQLGVDDGVSRAVTRYNGLAISAGRDPMTVQEAQWNWQGNLFGYDRSAIDRLADGLRRAGVPEGAGTDLRLGSYLDLVTREEVGQFTVRGVDRIDVLTAGALFDRGVRFIDVRPEAGYANGHVPRAVNLSVVTRLSREELLKVARPDDEVVFYCNSGYCEISAIAAAKAVRWGYRRVYLLNGGVPAWESADCPVEVASQ